MSESSKYRIEVRVRTAYLPGQSEPEANRYVFAYTVTITNTGSVPAKLLSRHWIITDANNRIKEVRGDGVVGEQPHLAPGTSFEYTSGTLLDTPVGSMEGSYHMVGDDGTPFEALIPRFVLSMPRTLH